MVKFHTHGYKAFQDRTFILVCFFRPVQTDTRTERDAYELRVPIVQVLGGLKTPVLVSSKT